MRARHAGLLAGLVLVAAVVGGALWLTGDRLAGARERGPRGPGDGARADGAPADVASPAGDRDGGAALAAGREAGRAEAAATEAELRAATWITGTVDLPADTPLDEEAWVTARAKARGDEYHRAPVGADGGFRVALPPGADEGWLDLDARFLYLDNPRRVRVAVARHVTLDARLGSELRVRLALPPGVGADEVAGAVAKLTAHEETDEGWYRVVPRGEVTLDGPAFAFGGVEPTARAEVTLEPDPFVPVERENLVLEAGRSLAIELPIELGVEIAGRVTAPDGAPVVGASVQARRRVQGWSPPRDATTDETGAYRVGGIEADAVVAIEVKKEGYVALEAERGPFAAGARIADVDFTLELGLGVSGVVLWSDGGPAAGAWLEVRPSPGNDDFEAWRSREQTQATRLGDDGAFDVAGLEGGRWVLRAWAPRPAEDDGPEPDLSDLSLRERRALRKARRDRPTWHARAEGVPAGTRGLELVLEPGGAVAGRVVDDLGAPVERYLLMAVPMRAELAEWERDQHARTERMRSPDGAFALDDVEPGDWELFALADGHGRSEPVGVTVPGAPADVVLVAPRAGAIAGRVVDADGRPVEGARVRARARVRGTSDQRETESARDTTDADGAFALDAVHPGPVTLTADAPGQAPAEELRLDVPPGGTLGGVEIVLGRAGRITGEVVDPSGRRLTDRSVTLRHLDRDDNDWRRVDHEGAFAFDGLAPGRYEVTSHPTEEEQEAIRDANGNVDWEQYRALMGQRIVELEAGQTAHVVLGAAGDQETALYGTVRAAGEPQEGITVVVEPAGGRSFKNRHQTQTDADGVYRVTVTDPGEYVVAATSPRGGWLRHEVSVDVAPGAREVVLDVELPGGSVRGRVVHADGSPAQGLMVEARGGAAHYSPWNAIRGVPTHADGAFALLHVPAGEYELAVGGPGASHRGRVAGVRVEAGRAKEGVEIVVSPTGAVEGTVLDGDGRAVDGARVLVFDAAGVMLSPTQAKRTDAQGRFRVEALPAERVTVRAVTGTQVTHRPAVAVVPAEGATSVQLVVEPGTELVVEVRGLDGRPVPADVRILDEAGADHAAARLHVYYNAAAVRRRYGPLAPGTYRVVADAVDGSSASELVTLDGQPEVAVTLRAR